MSIASPTELKRQLDAIKPTILRPETEESWDAIANALHQFGIIYNSGGADFLDELIPSTRSLTRQITSAMCSERTRLSGVAIDVVGIMASSLGRQFDALLSLFFPTLLVLCSRTNKVVIARARSCIATIIETTQLPAILPYFVQAIKDKSSSLRLTAAEGVLTCMNCFNPPDLEKEARALEIEVIIRATAKDASADVRKVSKKIFEAYGLLLPSRMGSFAAPLSPTTKKYLNIQIQPQLPSAKPATSHNTHVSKATKPASTLGVSQSSKSIPRPPSRNRGDASMPPPPSRPIRAAPPATTAPSNTASKDPQRVIDIRPKSQTDKPFPLVRPQRPVSATGSREVVPSNQTAPESSLARSGPQRVPITRPAPENHPKPAATTQPKPLKAPPQTKSALPTLEPVTRQRKTTLSKAGPSAIAKPQPPTAAVAATSGKGRSLTQPTLSQLSRIQPRKAGPSTAIPQAKPIWGQSARGAAPKPVAKSAKAANTDVAPSVIRAPLVTTPIPDTQSDPEQNPLAQEEPMIAPADVPLPPSPGNLTATVELPATEQKPEVVRNEKEEAGQTNGSENETDSQRLASSQGFGIHDVTTPSSLSPDDLFDFHSKAAKTPISALLSSIHHGFLLTPSSPLSPPSSYLPNNDNQFQIAGPDFTNSPQEETAWAGTPAKLEEALRPALQVVDLN